MHVQLCDPIDCPPDYSVHGILQATTLESVAIPFSRGSTQPRDWTWASRIAGRFFTIWGTSEAQSKIKKLNVYYLFISVSPYFSVLECDIISPTMIIFLVQPLI